MPSGDPESFSKPDGGYTMGAAAQFNVVGNELRALGEQFAASEKQRQYEHEFEARMTESLENRIVEQQRYGEALARMEVTIGQIHNAQMNIAIGINTLGERIEAQQGMILQKLEQIQPKGKLPSAIEYLPYSLTMAISDYAERISTLTPTGIIDMRRDVEQIVKRCIRDIEGIKPGRPRRRKERKRKRPGRKAK
jgi:hypothetical protein